MRNYVLKNISGKKVLFMFILTNLLYLIMLYVSIPKVMIYSDGIEIFDLMPMGYSMDYALKLLDTLGVDGRDVYLFQQIPLDLIYPFLFGVNYCLLIAYFLHKLNQIHKPIFYITILPLLGGFFDYLENVGIISMIFSFPHISVFQLNFSSISTILKSTFSTLSFSTLLVLILVFAIRRLKNRVI